MFLSIKSKIDTEETSFISSENIVPHSNSKLEVEDGTHRDLGSVKEGTYPHVSFNVTNIGTEETRILLPHLQGLLPVPCLYLPLRNRKDHVRG